MKNDMVIDIVAWAVTLIVILAGLYLTRSAWCIWGLAIPAIFRC